MRSSRSMGNPVSDKALDGLGDLGTEIRGLRQFRKRLRDSGRDYDSLSDLVSLPGLSETPGTESTTSWSQVTENVYARFLTFGHNLDVGTIEIRVTKTGRGPSATRQTLTNIDISSLVADPGVGTTQPLSFSPIFGSMAVPLLSTANPVVVVAFLAALIAAEHTDWEGNPSAGTVSKDGIGHEVSR